jgi:hypothetical protein
MGGFVWDCDCRRPRFEPWRILRRRERIDLLPCPIQFCDKSVGLLLDDSVWIVCCLALPEYLDYRNAIFKMPRGIISGSAIFPSPEIKRAAIGC